MTTFNPETISVALLSGGKSGERPISLASGDGVYDALCKVGFKVDRIDPVNKEDLVRLVQGTYDVAFLVLHGKFGEDGTIQGMLEILGIPYTGPGVWSSATAIDKPKTKIYYKRHGIPTPDSFTLKSPTDKTAEEIAEALGSRCVIKAATEGSSLGFYLCNSIEDIEHALEEVFTIDNQALAETFVAGDEFTVAVLGNEDPEVLPVIQIVPMNEFYDFESKYAVGGSKHICPAPLTEELTAKAQDIALRAHRALECRGVSRTDLLLDENGEFWALETNTIPGMTPTSLLPDAAKAIDINFEELCTKMIRNAMS